MSLGEGIFVLALFRPSRPDFIETRSRRHLYPVELHCSGHLGRTSLRRVCLFLSIGAGDELFRPSRPDFIETCAPEQGEEVSAKIVPAI